MGETKEQPIRCTFQRRRIHLAACGCGEFEGCTKVSANKVFGTARKIRIGENRRAQRHHRPQCHPQRFCICHVVPQFIFMPFIFIPPISGLPVSTAKLMSTAPALAKVNVPFTSCPGLKVVVALINMIWNDFGLSSTVLPAGIAKPSFSSSI